MPELLQVISDTCRRRRILAPGTDVLVAVSGGPDSVALLHALIALSDRLQLARIGVAHLHHGIRTADAEQDQEFVLAMADALGLPCFTDRVDVPALARAARRSLEDAARQSRYAFLHRVAREQGYHRIATGHTQDDQAETLLLSLVRGSGPGGLAGMAVQNGQVIRPMLDATRRQVLAFLRANSHTFRVDATNEDLAYRRNRVRHTLLPLLEREFNPNIRATLARTAEVLHDEEAWAGRVVESFLQRAAIVGQGAVAIDRAELSAQPLGLRRRAIRAAYLHLVEQLPCPLTLANVDGVLALLDGRTSARAALPAGVEAELTYENLELRRAGLEQPRAERPRELSANTPSRADLSLNGRLAVPALGWDISSRVLLCEHGCRTDPADWRWSHAPEDGRFVASLDLDRLALPLLIRRRVAGDRFWPHGAPGERKLKEFLIDAKIPRMTRACLPVLVDGSGRIGAVLPLRPADWAVVTADTRRVLRLEGRIENGPSVVKHQRPW